MSLGLGLRTALFPFPQTHQQLCPMIITNESKIDFVQRTKTWIHGVIVNSYPSTKRRKGESEQLNSETQELK